MDRFETCLPCGPHHPNRFLLTLPPVHFPATRRYSHGTVSLARKPTGSAMPPPQTLAHLHSQRKSSLYTTRGMTTNRSGLRPKSLQYRYNIVIVKSYSKFTHKTLTTHITVNLPDDGESAILQVKIAASLPPMPPVVLITERKLSKTHQTARIYHTYGKVICVLHV